MQSLKVGSYDPREDTLTVAGITLTGFAEGEFINIETESDLWDDTSGSDGEVGRWRKVDQRGTITVTLLKTSESNTDLSLLMNADAKTGKGTFPVIMKSGSASNDVSSGSVAWIRKHIQMMGFHHWSG
jgi:hypothetical protein